MTHARNLPSGHRLGPYTILEALGEGASAVVYRAEDALGAQVAVKVRATSTPASDRRFLREFDSLRTIRVPGVVKVHEAGVDGDLLWFSMDVVTGGSFREYLQAISDRATRVQTTIQVGRQLTQILHALHQTGFIHRDIKPSNVLVDREGRVRLLDFGIAQFFAERDTTRSTQHRHLMGTLPYMAPEQLAALPLTPAVDQFAAALMMHEALHEKRQSPRNAFGWIAKTCTEALPPLATLYRDVPLGLSKIIERMLDIDPRLRPSAQAATRTLRMLEAGMEFADWPEPAFVDPGPWWEPIESVFEGKGPRAWVLEGPSGSGRTRLSSQLKRMGALRGTWAVEIRCQVDSIGGPIETLLDALLRPIRHEPWSHRLMRPHAALLRRVWPTLPLSGSELYEHVPEPSRVAETVGDLILDLAEKHNLLLIVRRAERVDGLTGTVLSALARRVNEHFSMLVLHDRRWQTAASEQLIGAMERSGAGVLQMQQPTAQANHAISTLLCPHHPPNAVRGPPLRAVEAGLTALAHWRREPFSPLASAPWPLAIRHTPIPTEVLVSLAGKQAVDNPWAREGEYGWVLDSAVARSSVLSNIDDLAGAATRLADAWQATGQRADDEIAALRLLAGTPEATWAPALSAAHRAVSCARYGQARRWLQVIEALGVESHPSEAFSLASLQAEVAQITDPGVAPAQLLTRAEALARSPAQVEWCQLLAAESALNEGETRSALVSALRLASPRPELGARVAARALQLATRARLRLGGDATREFSRSKESVNASSATDLRVRQANVAADYALAQGDLLEARQRSRHALRLSSEAGHLGGAAACSARMGHVLRRLGRRRQAEDYARAAREAYQESGDHRAHAAATLALATLVAERCDTAAARPLLDQSVRRIRGLHLTHLLPRAMVLTLELATLQADTAEATVSLAGLEPGSFEEAPAAIVRWWRTRGETARALDVAPPTTSWGLGLYHLQRAQAYLAAGQDPSIETQLALALATECGFAEIALHAELIDTHTASEEVFAPFRNKAHKSLHVELHLGVMALDARRLSKTDRPQSKRAWESLRARSRQLGYRPGVEEADGWLEVEG